KRMIESVFDIKGGLYQRVNTRRDWGNLYSFHVVLGDMYRKLKEPIWGNDNDLQSAIGQWHRALEVERLIRTGNAPEIGASLQAKQTNRKFPESPTLRLNLAQAYRETKDVKRALAAYVDAADLFAAAGNPARARQLIAQTLTWTKESSIENAASEKEKLASLDRVAERMEKVFAASPIRVNGPQRLTSLAFDADGKRLAAGGNDQVGFVDLSKGEFVPKDSFFGDIKSGHLALAPGLERF